ncbi:MAG: hydroxyacid dehydrogenase [Gammaproteobacteria bacterium]|nr:hydroxyacid dehydrogenase [Gammaproteobacteria bacterium]
MKPTVILAPHWRTMNELFSPEALTTLQSRYELVWSNDDPIPGSLLSDALLSASALISATPVVSELTLDRAPILKTIIEVSGAFPDTIDYAACAARGVEVLSCSPGFRTTVAEMGLAMAIGSARGLYTEHELFRHNKEHWLEDHADTDFTLYGANIGFVGFGQIAQELNRLLAPFNPKVKTFDPWLSESAAEKHAVELVGFDDVLCWSRCLFITASPTTENKALLSTEALRKMPDHALLVILSRAHLVDFDAVTAEAQSGRLRVATDVFPHEPLSSDHPIRTASNALLSPHRAAAVTGGRQLIGDMIVDDLATIDAGQPQRRLAIANANTITALAGVGDASR